MDLQPLALRAYFEDITRRSRSIAEARGLRLATSTAGPLSEASVMADRDRLDQLLLILIDNALRHSPAGGTVHVELAVDRNGRTATLSVSDDGPGVGPDELERIFEPFERSATTRSQGEGAGLGLAIARQLAERQDADLGVESQLGEGATFRLSMKLLGHSRTR
jgi:signal transduction histidine kinase